MPGGRFLARPDYGWWGGYGYYGRGRGNPYPYCRNFPWLPGGWWACSGYSPHAPAAYTPVYPFAQPGVWNWNVGGAATELEVLKREAEMIRDALKNIETRIGKLDAEDEAR